MSSIMRQKGCAFLASLAGQHVIAFEEEDGELAGRIGLELDRVGLPIGEADADRARSRLDITLTCSHPPCSYSVVML
jgi:hypothetical protein